MAQKWSARATKSSVVDADKSLIIDSADGLSKQYAFSSVLAYIGKTNNATGFSLAGGTISKTLTVTDTSAINQDVSTTATPTWAGGTFTGALSTTSITASGLITANSGILVAAANGSISLNNTAGLTANSGISLWGGGSNYRIGFDNYSATRGWIRLNVDTADATHGWAFTAGEVANPLSAAAILQSDSVFILGAGAQGITPQAALHISQDGYFGTNLSINGSTTSTGQVIGKNGWIAGIYGASASGNRVVMGILNGAASLGAHNFGLSAWAPIYMQPEAQANVAIGLSAVGGQTPNAMIHGVRDTILGIPASALSDGSLYNGNVHPWVDESNNILNFKVKKSGGTVVTFPLGTSGGKDTVTLRVSTTVDTNAPTDDIVGLDSTSGSNLFVIDRTNLKRPITVAWTKGASIPKFQAASGQTINGLTTEITLGTLYTSATIVSDPNSSTGMFIMGFSTG